jgi:hypothetical protein
LLTNTGKYAAGGRDLPTSRAAGLATAAELAPQTQDSMQSPASTPPTVTNLPQQESQVVQEPTGIIRFSRPMKVVKIPMAGKPGQFVTGLVPLASNSPISPRERGQTPLPHDPTHNLALTPRMKIALLIAVILLIAAGVAGFLWFIHHTHTPSQAAFTFLMESIDG